MNADKYLKNEKLKDGKSDLSDKFWVTLPKYQKGISMASVPNSEYRYSQRTDGGPFAELLLLDSRGIPTDIQDEVERVDVYYSDKLALEDDVTDEWPWVRIMCITKDFISIWPVQQRGDHKDYGRPLYGSIEELFIAPQTSGPYELPTSIEELDGFLESLPVGFYKNWRYGLGLRWEFRSIVTTIAEIPGITTVCFHCSQTRPGTDRLEPPYYFLGMHTYHQLRREITLATARHQRAARKEKAAICYNRLLHQVAPKQFEVKRLSLPADSLANLSDSSRGQVTLTKRDQRAAVALVRGHASDLVKSEPSALLQLKQDIELVTLRELIARCSELLDKSATEAKWQSLLSRNPFILTMAFHYPVILIGEQPYVGGKQYTGRGGSYSDFLLAATATKNLALVEIKHPGIPLLAKAYRGIYPPSGELSGAVAQVISQRAELQSSFKITCTEIDRRGYQPHSIACVVIIGRNPSCEEQAKGFEQYRHSLHGVHVVTFDELVERLQSLYDLLAPRKTLETSQPDDSVTF
ncbi:Shedu immune nuclease family protein [Aeromonas dhakensis]|uniref:Shedu immune nuclease family protein n=1 Tax=Aeromonas dhakensis TaxID=196024 RepID=UPI003EDF91C1